MKIVLAVARIVYSLTIAVAAVAAVNVGTLVYRSFAYPNPFGRNPLADLLWIAFFSALTIPVVRVIARKIAGRALIDAPSNTEFRAYLAIVTLLATLGLFCDAVVASVYIDLWWNRPKNADVGGVGLFIIAAAALRVLALWIGEFVLEHRTGSVATLRST